MAVSDIVPAEEGGVNAGGAVRCGKFVIYLDLIRIKRVEIFAGKQETAVDPPIFFSFVCKLPVHHRKRRNVPSAGTPECTDRQRRLLHPVRIERDAGGEKIGCRIGVEQRSVPHAAPLFAGAVQAGGKRLPATGNKFKFPDRLKPVPVLVFEKEQRLDRFFRFQSDFRLQLRGLERGPLRTETFPLRFPVDLCGSGQRQPESAGFLLRPGEQFSGAVQLPAAGHCGRPQAEQECQQKPCSGSAVHPFTTPGAGGSAASRS